MSIGLWVRAKSLSQIPFIDLIFWPIECIRQRQIYPMLLLLCAITKGGLCTSGIFPLYAAGFYFSTAVSCIWHDRQGGYDWMMGLRPHFCNTRRSYVILLYTRPLLANLLGRRFIFGCSVTQNFYRMTAEPSILFGHPMPIFIHERLEADL